MKYNKLIRDNIPEIIKNNGKECTIEVLNNEKYIYYLEEKLKEEMAEYFESKDVEELYRPCGGCLRTCEGEGIHNRTV